MNKKEFIQEELEEIAKQHDGLLRPADVVEFAKDEDTALHDQFEWDDSKAGYAYRLWQARQVISIHITVIEQTQQETRLFVSMPRDRTNGGGYRLTVDVMSDDEQRRELLKEAHQRFKYWQNQYKQLSELVPVFEAMDKVMSPLMLPELAEAA